MHLLTKIVLKFMLTFSKNSAYLPWSLLYLKTFDHVKEYFNLPHKGLAYPNFHIFVSSSVSLAPKQKRIFCWFFLTVFSLLVVHVDFNFLDLKKKFQQFIFHTKYFYTEKIFKKTIWQKNIDGRSGRDKICLQ